MYYNLFLDDERFPKNVTWMELPSVEWIIVRNYQRFVDIINEHGMPARVSFDHDLGESAYRESIKCFKENSCNINYNNITEKTGLDCAKWLIEYCININQKFPEYFVHSLNPVGKNNIISLIESFKKHN